jgi:hypothetical protein
VSTGYKILTNGQQEEEDAGSSDEEGFSPLNCSITANTLESIQSFPETDHLLYEMLICKTSSDFQETNLPV